MFQIRLVKDDTNIPFIKWHRVGITFALVASLVSLGMFFWPGLNYGIDFQGGVLIEARTEQATVDPATLRQALEELGRGQISLQNLGSPQQFLVRLQRQDTEKAQQEAIAQIRAVLTQYLPDLKIQRTEAVGAAVSSELIEQGLLAVGLGLLAMMAYMWFRFEWQFGLGALLSLLSEVCIILGFFALTQLPFTLASVAAVLALIGYSINDKVVIYDRIRENRRLYKKLSLSEIIDRSLNRTLNRTLGTSLSTIIAVLPLAIFSTQTLRGFTWPLLFGIISGTASSLLVAAPLLLWFSAGLVRPNDLDAPLK